MWLQSLPLPLLYLLPQLLFPSPTRSSPPLFDSSDSRPASTPGDIKDSQRYGRESASSEWVELVVGKGRRDTLLAGSEEGWSAADLSSLELESNRLLTHQRFMTPDSLITQNGSAFLRERGSHSMSRIPRKGNELGKEKLSPVFGPTPSPPAIYPGPSSPIPSLAPRALTSDPTDQTSGEGSVPSIGAPWPPSWLDINNVSSLQLMGRAAVTRMQTWLQPDQQYQWTPWWQTPVIGIFYADLDLTFGDQYNRRYIEGLLNANDFGVSYMIDKYVDDQAWWGIFALKGYQLYGNVSWLQAAAVIQKNSSLYWDDDCGGGVLWLTYDKGYKNTITNTLYLWLNTRLYLMTGIEDYFRESMRVLNWWLGWAFDTETGKVWDGMKPAPDCSPEGQQIYTYNSGTILPPLVDLYYATGNETLLDLARSIAYAGIRDYSTPDAGITKESCEDDGQPSPDMPPGCQQDQVAFKGIFLSGLGYLYQARPDEDILNYINTQFLSASFNNLDNTFLFGEWWYGPWNETTAGPKTQLCALGLLSAAISADVSFARNVAANSNNGANAGGVSGGTPVVTVPTTALPTGGSVQQASDARLGLESTCFGMGALVFGVLLAFLTI